MATLAGQRASFTWALNQYNLAEEPEKREHYAKLMAKYIKAAPANGFTPEQVTQKKTYPAEVDQYLISDEIITDVGIKEEEAIKTVAGAVDTSDVVRVGEGSGVVYAYGFACCPDRLKVGSTESDAIQRIATQIGTSTPDKPALRLEIKTNYCRALEKAIQATLESRGRKIIGGGTEWFKTDRDEIVAIYHFIAQA
jgi:hypothetical protein